MKNGAKREKFPRLDQPLLDVSCSVWETQPEIEEKERDKIWSRHWKETDGSLERNGLWYLHNWGKTSVSIFRIYMYSFKIWLNHQLRIKNRYLTDMFRTITRTTRFVILLEKSHHNLLQYLSACHNQGRRISWTCWHWEHSNKKSNSPDSLRTHRTN